MEIIARDDRADPKTADQDFNDESLRMKACQNLVEGDDDHAVDAELLQRPGLGVARREAKIVLGPLKKSAGCGSKVGTAQGQLSSSASARALDHREMTAMNAIEIADRDHRACKSGRRRGRINGGNEIFSAAGRIGQGNPNRKTPCERPPDSAETACAGRAGVKTAPCRFPRPFYQTSSGIAAVGREVRGFQELPERGSVEAGACGAVQLLAMDAGCHKKTIKSLWSVRAFDIGPHGVANHEYPVAIDGLGARPPRQFERPAKIRGKRLAGLDHLAARPGVAFAIVPAQ